MKDDFGRMALGAPALQSITLVTLPDCLLLKQWSRDNDADGDSAAAHIGGAFRSAQDALRAVSSSKGTGSVSIETDEALVVISPLAVDAAAGFVFDRSAPLGLVRVQVAQLTEHLKGLLQSIRGSRDLSADLSSPSPSPSAPANPTVVMASPRGPELPQPSPLSVAPIPPPASTPPTATPAPAYAPPAPASPPAQTPAQRFQASPPPPHASSPSLSAVDTKARPRSVRLLEFFRRYAPDPHASMLRLSLRTGISLDQLERPEALDEAQVEVLAGSVRDILGQDNVGV